MRSSHFSIERPALLAALTAGGAALCFALATGHAWEDYYITFRASKNFAEGHGLVYQLGERLQTYTSPAGTLLPALASLLTGNRSDFWALWIFRGLSIAAFGAGAGLLWTAARSAGYAALTSAFLVGWLVCDAKSLDFTINGMETGLLLCGLCYALRSLFASSGRRSLHLGVAAACLLWTRPDGFVYAGALAAGVLLCNQAAVSGQTRLEWGKVFLRAAGVAALAYLPWVLAAWAYYGTPVSHTITAKASAAGSAKSAAGVLHAAVGLITGAWSRGAAIETVFLPSYFGFGGWPQALVYGLRPFALVAAFFWVAPFARWPGRSASFAFFCCLVYVFYFPNYVYPWYLPAPALLGLFALAGALDGAMRLHRWRIPAILAAGLFLSAEIWMTVASARQLSAQQTWVETGVRHRIGEWLRTQARPTDTVFLEPLGYVGYFSQLKMYDYPGLSSREVVAARTRVGNDWNDLVKALWPDWLVLRPSEIRRMRASDPALLETHYIRARQFSEKSAIQRLDIRGKSYLEHDDTFVVYRLIPPHPGR